MIIGIDASRAFVKKRTGIEEYSYQVIKHLMNKLENHRVILYIKSSQQLSVNSYQFPENWKIKVIRWPYLWTQIGLSLELLFHPMDILFVPAHTVPLIHPKNTIVTIHGLEYEFCPRAYSFWERMYMRFVIKNSCRWAKNIIAVSENTKRDLTNLYKVPEEKIDVIYEGVNYESRIMNHGSGSKDNQPYLLFIGRLEERKNILGIIKAFEILKDNYKIPHKLILAGKPGYNYKSAKCKVQSSKFRKDIFIKGFVGEDEKQELLKNADVFLFPSFYEGFGLPILEAQAVGVPVVASIEASIPEIVCPKAKPSDSRRLRLRGKESAILVDPNNSQEIADAVFSLISNEKLKNDIIKKGLENVKRFSWERCASEISKWLNG